MQKIKKIFNQDKAAKLLIAALLMLALFHVLAVLGIVPINMVWGGNLDKRDEFIKFEIFALSLTLLFLFTAAIFAGFIRNPFLVKAAGVFIWLMSVYFFFNIIGNVFAKTAIEKVVFIPLSLILFISSLRLAVGE